MGFGIRTLCWSAALLVMVAAPALAQPVPTIPPEFHGRWAFNLANCRPDYYGESNPVRVEAHRITFYESSATPTQFYVRGSDEILFRADMEGEGSHWVATKHYRLSADGRQLINGDRPSDPTYRCPTRAAAEG